MTTLTAYIEHDRETWIYVANISGVPSADAGAATLDELQANLREVLDLLLEEDASRRERVPRFVGVQPIERA
jgi:predicted RNase H-like HicB family nuclease